jgi:methylphosphotriester-DNA--protein-cysteine methyltransferase
MDWRVAKLIEAIDTRSGATGCNLGRTCQKLKLDISPAYAARLFKRQTGLGVKQYAKKQRLLTAIERLTTTNVPVKAIATDLGYRKTFDFARVFKEQCGLTPTRFRQASRRPSGQALCSSPLLGCLADSHRALNKKAGNAAF